VLTEVEPADFDASVRECADPQLVLFHASWCGFCTRFRPQFEARARETGDRFVKVDISDEECPLWDDLGIKVVPTVIIFSGGKEMHRESGMLGPRHLDVAMEKFSQV